MNRTRRICLMALAAITIALAIEAVPSEAVVVPEGTPIQLKFAQSVSSRSTRPGQAIEFAVAETLTVNGAVLIREGDRAIGYVVMSASAETGGKGGALAIEVSKVRANKTLVNVRGERRSVEKREVGKTVGLTILFGLSGYMMSGGKQAEIKIDTPVVAYVAEDTPVVPFEWRTPPPSKDKAAEGTDRPNP